MTEHSTGVVADPAAEYWTLVARRRFSFCRCGACGHAWLPPSLECPACLEPRAEFEAASGAATLLSWVVFHRAYHDTVAQRVPYTVGLLQLAEGPRLVANVPVGEALRTGKRMRLRYEDDGVDGQEALRPAFIPVDGA